jgi:DNA-binding transcriptional regulator YiaG
MASRQDKLDRLSRDGLLDALKRRDTTGDEKMRDYAEQGARIRAARRKLRLSQAALGELIGGAPATTISNWETGRRRPSTSQAEQLRDVLGIDGLEIWTMGGVVSRPAAGEPVRTLDGTVVGRVIRMDETGIVVEVSS